MKNKNTHTSCTSSGELTASTARKCYSLLLGRGNLQILHRPVPMVESGLRRRLALAAPAAAVAPVPVVVLQRDGAERVLVQHPLLVLPPRPPVPPCSNGYKVWLHAWD